jgi:hypothetical protein
MRDAYAPDMIVGKRAHAEVYPAMVEWLMQKSGVHSQSSSAGEVTPQLIAFKSDGIMS